MGNCSYSVESNGPLRSEYAALGVEQYALSLLKKQGYDPTGTRLRYDEDDHYLDGTLMLDRPLQEEHRKQFERELPLRLKE